MFDIQQARTRLNKDVQEHAYLKKLYEEERVEYIRIDNLVMDCEVAQKLVQDAAEAVQQQIHQQISTVVSRCLATVFSDPYEFRIKFEQKRGRTEATLVFVRDGMELDDPINQAGGGMVDIAAFALRLVCIALQRPHLQKILVLDEPFKNIRGAANRDRVKGLLEALASELGFQFLLNVDHEIYPQFALGKIVDLG